MTIVEYARMLMGEHWLSEKANAIYDYNITTKQQQIHLFMYSL
jgi:hypothetical protein